MKENVTADEVKVESWGKVEPSQTVKHVFGVGNKQVVLIRTAVQQTTWSGPSHQVIFDMCVDF